ncbi:MAG: MFS transporter [Chitinophagaceae bacterium]|nr:MFS transporter [Chitinophagaceae bacterium]MCW5906132.1 MFS transporter [Chitinophagaceae bacterium]
MSLVTQKSISKEVQQITVYSILFSISFSHMLNDTIQSLIPSIYPLLKNSFALNFAQIGLIQLTFQMTASILQPLVGTYTDKKPQPFSLAIGMAISLIGLICISYANSFSIVLFSVALIGTGSSIFHPESSKIAYMASGGKRGLAQSIFQVGGNTGSAIGPLLAALVVVKYGRSHAVYFGILAIIAIVILLYVGKWAKQQLIQINFQKNKKIVQEYHPRLSKKKIRTTVIILLILIFSKNFYLSSIGSYYTFFLIEKFHVSIQHSQLLLFIFLASSALGTYFGGPLGDKYGRKYVIWFSILGVAPFTLLLPYVSLFWTVILSILIAFILSSAFPAILVYAQELMPGRIGMISGLFFGFAFGMGGLGSALLGILADYTSIGFVYKVCSFLPLIGLITWWLPKLKKT